MGNRFTTPGNIEVGGGGASNNQIVYNHFDHTRVAESGPGLSPTRVGDANIVFNLRPSDKPQNQNNVVAFNHFDSGNVYGIWVGTYDLESRFGYIYKAQTLISNNLWSNWDGKNAIEIKSHSNIVQYNTVVGGGRAKILNRNGTYSQFIGNWLENNIGMHFYDNDHLLLGNKVIGGGKIFLMANGYVGSAADAAAGKGLRKGADNSQLIGNTGTVILGYEFGDLKNPSAVKNVCIQNHTGAITNGPQGATGTRSTCGWTGSIPEARKLSPGEVGTIRFVGSNKPGCSAAPTDPGTPVTPVDPGEPTPALCQGTFSLGPDYKTGWAVHKTAPGASVTQEANGLVIQAAPIGSGESVGSVALWSKCLKSGTWRAEFDYTQLDATTTTNANGVFSQFWFSVLDKEIAESASPEEASPATYTSYEPTDHYYEDLVTGYRISFDTFNTTAPDLSNKIRMRQFNADGVRPPIDPVSVSNFPFTKDITYRVTVDRSGSTFNIVVRDPAGGIVSQRFLNSGLNQYQNGFFGFRFSEGKRARISNFSVR